MTFAIPLAVSLLVVVPTGAAIAEGAASVPRTPTDTQASPAADVPPAQTPTFRRDVVRVSGGNPLYPRAAVRAGITKGMVVARFAIDESGNVSNIVIVSAEPPGVFDRAVIDWLKESKYRALGEKYFGEVKVKFELR